MNKLACPDVAEDIGFKLLKVLIFNELSIQLGSICQV